MLDVVPELRVLHDEHVDFYGEILPYVLLADVVRWVVDAVKTDSSAPPNDAPWARLLDFIEYEFNSASGEVQNLIALGFVENLPEPAECVDRLISSLGPKVFHCYQSFRDINR
jgi:hypothetical protein